MHEREENEGKEIMREKESKRDSEKKLAGRGEGGKETEDISDGKCAQVKNV